MRQRLRNFMSKNSQIRYREKHPTITLTCESKQQYANIVEQSKQQNLSISNYLKKIIFSDIEEQDERDKKLNEGQKLLADQIHKQQIERNELEQKKYELEQKKDAIAAEKKDLMDFAGEIGGKLSELSRVEQKIERNKHFLFLTGEHEKVLERISLS